MFFSWEFRIFFTICFFILKITVGLATAFKCPESNGFFADPKQCDKYYECVDSQPEEKLCPDGLLFEIKNPNHERCDLPFSVDCGERTELRKSQYSIAT